MSNDLSQGNCCYVWPNSDKDPAHSASHLNIHQESHVVIGCLLACLWIKRRGRLIALHCVKRKIFKKINVKFTKYFLSRLFVTPWSSTFSIKGPNYHTKLPGVCLPGFLTIPLNLAGCPLNFQQQNWIKSSLWWMQTRKQAGLPFTDVDIYWCIRCHKFSKQVPWCHTYNSPCMKSKDFSCGLTKSIFHIIFHSLTIISNC